MNSNWKRNVWAMGTALMFTATIASAQEYRAIATVPFGFSVNGTPNLAPGNYEVIHNGNLWFVRSEDTLRAVVIPSIAGVEDRADVKPSLTFTCLGHQCQLRVIHAGYGAPGVEVQAPKVKKADDVEAKVVNVPLEPKRGA